MRKMFLAAVLSTTSCVALSQVSLPYTFVAGKAAKASEVNSNFKALADSINDLATRVEILEGAPEAFTRSAMSGKYKLLSIYSGGSSGSTSNPSVQSSTQKGSLTLNADATFTLATAETNSNTILRLATDTSSSAVTTSSGTLTGTWSIANKTITLTASDGGTLGPYEIGAGNRLLINPVVSDGSRGVLGIDIFVRQ